MRYKIKKMSHLINKILFGSLILQSSVLMGSHDSFAATLSEPTTARSENKNSQPVVADESEDALEDLLGILSKETEIATKTKMNIDFVPGMVTVLHGKDLLAKGVVSVFEALKLVPGVDLNIAGDGQAQLIFRGLGKLFGSGKVKVLVNGIGFNNTFTAQTQLTGIPIEQVERIEVIRGPGSTIHGEFAFAGVIDVITKDTDSEIFTRVGDLNSRMLGGIFVHKDKENDFSVSLNVSVSESDPDNVFAGEDALFILGPPLELISNSPGPVNDDEEHLAAIFKIDYKGMTFTGEKTHRGFGSFFGATNVLPDANSGIIREADYQVFEFTTPIKINDSVTSKLKAGWASFEFEATDQMLFPVGFGGPGIFPEGVLATPHYEEDKYYVGYEMHFPDLGDHDLLWGVDYARIEQGDTHLHRNFTVLNPGPPPLLAPLNPPEKFTGAANWITEDNDRSILGLFVQDQYFITESFNITAGIRFDDYDDVGSSTSPRLAAVYHLGDHQTLKAQYAEAFRPPTFVELYSNNAIVNSNPELKAETIKSYELGYVYNDGVSIGRITLFTADLEDLIGGSNATPVTFQNIGQAEQTGIELEYVRQIGKSLKLDTNFSFVEVTDQMTNTDFSEIANIQANIGVIYQPFNNFSLSGQYRYTGEKDRVATDNRSALDSFNTIDITASLFNLMTEQLTFRVGVKNLFDEDLFYPAPINTYVNDYPQPGREWWSSLAYKF